MTMSTPTLLLLLPLLLLGSTGAAGGSTPSTAELRDRALQAQAGGDLPAAEASFRALIARDSADGLARCSLGSLLLSKPGREGRRGARDALPLFKACAKLSPRSFSAWTALASTHMTLAQHRRARKALTKAKGLTKGRPARTREVFYLLAEAERHLAEHSSAIGNYRRAIGARSGGGGDEEGVDRRQVDEAWLGLAQSLLSLDRLVAASRALAGLDSDDDSSSKEPVYEPSVGKAALARCRRLDTFECFATAGAVLGRLGWQNPARRQASSPSAAAAVAAAAAASAKSLSAKALRLAIHASGTTGQQQSSGSSRSRAGGCLGGRLGRFYGPARWRWPDAMWGLDETDHKVRRLCPASTHVDLTAVDDFLSAAEVGPLLRAAKQWLGVPSAGLPASTGIVDEQATNPGTPLVCFDSGAASSPKYQHMFAPKGVKNLGKPVRVKVPQKAATNARRLDCWNATDLRNSGDDGDDHRPALTWSSSLFLQPQFDDSDDDTNTDDQSSGNTSSIITIGAIRRLLGRIEKKIEDRLGLPSALALPTQILRYPAGGAAYQAHTDCTEHGVLAGDRAVTVLLYLHSNTESRGDGDGDGDGEGGGGGATAFPRLGVQVEPAEGRLAVFRSADRGRDGFCLPQSLHESLPTSGDAGKYVIQKFYRQPGPEGPPGGGGSEASEAAKTARPGQAAAADKGDSLLRALRPVLARGQSYVLCDGSGSCREYVSLEERQEQQQQQQQQEQEQELSHDEL